MCIDKNKKSRMLHQIMSYCMMYVQICSYLRILLLWSPVFFLKFSTCEKSDHRLDVSLDIITITSSNLRRLHEIYNDVLSNRNKISENCTGQLKRYVHIMCA